MTVVMLPIASMSEFADIVMKYKPNHVGGSDAGWREFPKNQAAKTADLSFLKACCSGNDSLTLETKLRVDDNGVIYFDGRLKRTIITNVGSKIAPMEYERILTKHENMGACCGAGRKNPEHTGDQVHQVPVAFLVLKEESTKAETIAEVKVMMDSQLADNTHIYDNIVIEKLPMTQNDKIDYRKMKRIAEGR